MRKTPATTLAGAITLVALGALTSYALRPVQKPAPPAPAAEVRTQIVRRTIWIVKHEKPSRAQRPRVPAAGAPPRRLTGAATPSPAASAGATGARTAAG